jgi:hypothetical protein
MSDKEFKRKPTIELVYTNGYAALQSKDDHHFQFLFRGYFNPDESTKVSHDESPTTDETDDTEVPRAKLAKTSVPTAADNTPANSQNSHVKPAAVDKPAAVNKPADTRTIPPKTAAVNKPADTRTIPPTPAAVDTPADTRTIPPKPAADNTPADTRNHSSSETWKK